jgi:Fe2+ or Zn2+ uptake regulation protein
MSKRYSIQRQIIVETLKKMDHPTAQDMVEEIRKEYPHLSVGTVYRNLNFLSAEGIVSRLLLHDSADRFETRSDPHHHIQCTLCEKYFDVDKAYFGREIDEKIEEATGFRVEERTVFFRGVCPSCQKE